MKSIKVPAISASIMKATIVLLAILILCEGCSQHRNTINTKNENSKITISLWHPWGGLPKDQLLRVVAEFNRTHKDLQVQPLFTPTDIGSNQKFFTAVAAKKAPDVIFVDGTQTASWAEQGALIPLDEYIRRDGVKQSDYFQPCWAQNFYKNRVWALTYCADPNFALVWNKKTFREVGLDPEKPPTTIEELDRYNERLTKIVNGKIVRIGIIPWGQYSGANSLFTWGWAFKGKFFDPKTNKITANDPNVLKAFEWMVSYAKKYDVTKISAFSSGFGSRDQDPLYTGQVAMKCLYVAGIEDIKKYAPNLDYGIGYIPAPTGGEKHSSWVGGWCLGIPKGCKHPKAAWEFIKWCCHSKEGTSAVGNNQGLFPGYMASPYMEKVRTKPGYGQFLRILEECRHQRPVMPAQTFYMGALDRAIEYAVYGRMTPKQALDRACRQTQAELNLRLAGR